MLTTIQIDITEGSYSVSYELVTNPDTSITVKVDAIPDLVPHLFTFEITDKGAICAPEPRVEMNIYELMAYIQQQICIHEEFESNGRCC